MADTIRWGVLGTAKIARNQLIPALLLNEGSSLAGVASRDQAKAQQYLDDLGIDATAYGSYEALLDDPDIDAIYNPLPNHLHVPMTLEAAKRGKHVLCEKPIATTRQEAEVLRDVPDGVHVMEAFMVRFHPQWERAQAMVRDGALGEVRAMQVAFCYHNMDPANVRNMADIGGGGVLDIGCYVVVAGRMGFDREPKRALALIDRDPTFGTDRLATGVLDFGGGHQLSFTVSTQLSHFQHVSILGTEARLHLEPPFNPSPEGVALRLVAPGKEEELIEIGAVHQFEREVEAFNRAIRGEAPLPYGVDDALINMAILDALFASERQGGWVDIDYAGLAPRLID